jgi:hypothetical protein
MKQMFDPTQPWEDFYLVDWLINGGPPLDGCCPKVIDNVSVEAQTVSIHADTDIFNGEITWSISQLGYVLFKSTNYADIESYMTKYAVGISHFAYENRLEQ